MRRRAAGFARLIPIAALLGGFALAHAASEVTSSVDGASTGDGPSPVDAASSEGGANAGETVVIAAVESPGRATSSVRAPELERRVPRSTPDALRFEPGVFVQQTGTGQGSAFLRGLTGQQTVLLFDGVRLNNSTYRQGPNQYLFTIDPRSVESLEVHRGGASTLYGSDALGGAVLATPLEPSDDTALRVRPEVSWRGTTADREYGGRAQLEVTGLGGPVAFIGGVGARHVGLLESSGSVRSPEDGSSPEVPRLDTDRRTQLGTGFRELTADGRLVYRPADGHRVTLAAYAYRQSDAPRTDLCPPPGARYDECLTYDEQFRTLALGSWSATLGGWAERVRTTLSWQRQHERRTLSRPASAVASTGRDDVDTFALDVSGRTSRWAARPWLGLSLRYGAEARSDAVASRAWLRFTDLGVTLARSRGQYLDGSSASSTGAFLEALATLGAQLSIRAGARASGLFVTAPADPESGSASVSRTWAPIAATGGLEWKPVPALTVYANLDRSFRAPNLDDLTARQQAGPGFQFENPGLAAEHATSLELGARLRANWLAAELWAFETRLEGAIGKAPRSIAQCPPQTPQCETSWFRYQLVNARGAAEIRGVEGAVRARLPLEFHGRATFSWTFGEGPSLVDPPVARGGGAPARVPLSRIPPAHGTVELQWLSATGLSVGAVLRWAGPQRRLAIADRSDPRIPLGGTPGFAVVDLRASLRVGRTVALAATLENLVDTPYRFHGSSVNGPCRGASASLELTPW